MGAKKTRELPARLESARRRFERWRRTRKVRCRTPDSLWNSAVKAARTYGIHRTAKTLGVDYYSLKKRVEQQAVAPGSLSARRSAARPAAVAPAGTSAASDAPDEGAATRFLELAPIGRAGSAECILELEDAGGAKMRVHLKGLEAPDLTALTRTFWGVDS